ncbi:YceI family protein [Niastella caeni]|uniref:YceI family protein n=1 Tax=Niastella caeni TaxID=2569763 RepID=A0A4S8HWF1_9BACT|nr:YceI family protein [Niastella caeni]THU39551.1 YceI family protein [Niastella caeni]
MKCLSTTMPSAAAAILIFISGLLTSVNSIGQIKYHSNGSVKLIVEGTSNIHDWDIKSEKGVCSADFMFTPTGHLGGMTALQFTVPAESLKSNNKSMDKNTYKALNTDKYNTISFVANNAAIKPNGAGFTLVTRGKLTISGVTRDVELTANGVLNPDKSITYSGTYKLKMTDYKVTPPSIMLGAIKTGDAVTIKFDMVLKAV